MSDIFVVQTLLLLYLDMMTINLIEVLLKSIEVFKRSRVLILTFLLVATYHNIILFQISHIVSDEAKKIHMQ